MYQQKQIIIKTINKMKVTEKQIFNAYLAIITVALLTYLFIVLAIINNFIQIF